MDKKMALYVFNALSPLGEFDVLDTDVAAITGGEVMTLDEAALANSSSEKAVADILDGYVDDGVSGGTSGRTRVVARIADTSSETNLFYLSDDGITGYGTMMGKVVGGTAGLVTAGTSLGPSTVTGSGKVTLWDKAGLYGVSLGSVSADVVPTNPLVSGYFDTPLPGELLYRGQTTGKLTRDSGSSDKIALFVELAPTGSLVTTPAHLVGGSLLNSFSVVKIQFLGSTHNA